VDVPTDPLEVLRGGDGPVAPNPGFRAALRARLADLLDLAPTPGGTVSDTTTAVAQRHLRPCLTLVGADAAIAFYAAAFGAVVVGDLFRDADGRVGHVELDVQGSGFYLADAYPEYGNTAPDPAAGHSVALHLEVADTDATVTAAVAAGATVVRPAEDQPYGARSATLLDPFGHRWTLMGPLATPMSDDEIVRAMADIGVEAETIDLGERAPVTTPASEPGHAPAGPLVHGLGYFTIDVPDAARAARFYAELFGWVAEPSGPAGGFHLANIEPPGGIDPEKSEVGITAYLRVDDLATAVDRVRELGGEVLSVTTYPSGGNAVCRDDQGVAFQLWEPAPEYR
jgi:uncharacterized glyoxalase superfamily protein PhnB